MNGPPDKNTEASATHKNVRNFLMIQLTVITTMSVIDANVETQKLYTLDVHITEISNILMKKEGGYAIPRQPQCIRPLKCESFLYNDITTS